jgi:hypothetical protein
MFSVEAQGLRSCFTHSLNLAQVADLSTKTGGVKHNLFVLEKWDLFLTNFVMGTMDSNAMRNMGISLSFTVKDAAYEERPHDSESQFLLKLAVEYMIATVGYLDMYRWGVISWPYAAALLPHLSPEDGRRLLTSAKDEWKAVRDVEAKSPGLLAKLCPYTCWQHYREQMTVHSLVRSSFTCVLYCDWLVVELNDCLRHLVTRDSSLAVGHLRSRTDVVRVCSLRP